MFREMRRFKQQISEAECLKILQEQPRGVLSLLGDGGYLCEGLNAYTAIQAAGCDFLLKTAIHIIIRTAKAARKTDRRSALYGGTVTLRSDRWQIVSFIKKGGQRW